MLQDPPLEVELPLEVESGDSLGQEKHGQGEVEMVPGPGLGGDRVVDGIQLEKRSRRREMAESCLWWTEAGTYFTEHARKLSAWTMRSAGDTVVWLRYP